MDDDQLSYVVSRIPPGGILLIEDIDCAFPSREDEEDDDVTPQFRSPRYSPSQITLSGLLNLLDGIGSGTYGNVPASYSAIYVVF
jgi:mitochondrial chaperone BCS1